MSDPRGGIPIAEAAAQLGVTVELLRKRAQRKTIPAYKADGRWFIVVDAALERDDLPDGTDQDGTSRPGRSVSWTADQASRPTAVPLAARAQLDAIRDEWLQPLIDQLKEQAEQIGRLEAERDIVTGERDELRRRVAGLEAELRRDVPNPHPTHSDDVDAPDAPDNTFVAGPPAWRRAPEAVPPPAPRRPWWRRLLGRP